MSSWGFSSSTSIGQLKAQNGSLISNLNNQGGLPMNSQSFGQLKHPSASAVRSQGSASGVSYSNSKSSVAKTTDIGSIFASVSNGHPTPRNRIAPPPATAIGRGSGRQSKASQSIYVQGPPEQPPPLLDLL